jgi:hypothetical protein
LRNGKGQIYRLRHSSYNSYTTFDVLEPLRVIAARSKRRTGIDGFEFHESDDAAIIRHIDPQPHFERGTFGKPSGAKLEAAISRMSNETPKLTEAAPHKTLWC